MPERTLADVLGELREALDAKTVLTGAVSTLTRLDPAYDTLRALVVETRDVYCTDLLCWAVVKPNGKREAHLHPEPVLRTAYWLAAPNGASEGAILKATEPIAAFDDVASKIEKMLNNSTDTRIPAWEVVLAWVKRQP